MICLMRNIDGNCALCIQEKATKIRRINGSLCFLGSHGFYFLSVLRFKILLSLFNDVIMEFT